MDVSSSPSGSNGSIAISEDKLEALPFFPGPRPYSHHYAHWLQRRNSLSSRQAIFPANYRSFNSRRYSGRPPSFRGSLRRSVSNPDTVSNALLALSFTTMDTVTEVEVSPISSPSRMSSSVSSSSTMGSSPQRVRLGRQVIPIPAIPDRLRSFSSNGSIGRTATTTSTTSQRQVSEPAWSPALRHTPLTADPSIRALSSCQKIPQPRSIPTEDLENAPLKTISSNWTPHFCLSISSDAKATIIPGPEYPSLLSAAKPTVAGLVPGHTVPPRMARGDINRPSPARYRQQRAWSYSPSYSNRERGRDQSLYSVSSCRTDNGHGSMGSRGSQYTLLR